MTRQQAGVSALTAEQVERAIVPLLETDALLTLIPWRQITQRLNEALATAPPEQAQDSLARKGPSPELGNADERGHPSPARPGERCTELKNSDRSSPESLPQPQSASAGALPTEIDIVKRILSAHQTAYAQAHNTEGHNVIESDNIAIGYASVELANLLAAHDQKVRAEVLEEAAQRAMSCGLYCDLADSIAIRREIHKAIRALAAPAASKPEAAKGAG